MSNKINIFNKTMDFKDLDIPDVKDVINDLNGLVKELNEKKFKISSWYGHFDISEIERKFENINRGYDYKKIDNCADDANFPWFLYWEISWVVINANFLQGQKVLDLGGSSSLFSYYLASKGLDVTTVDLQKELVDNANLVAKKTGWNLKNFFMDIRDLNFSEEFDHITSICVFEHIPMYDRVKINKKIKSLLKNSGRFSITFDYKNPSKLAMINSKIDINNQFIKPSGLKLRGNKEFYDNGERYLLHPFYYKNKLWKYKKNAILNNEFSFWEFLKSKNNNDYTFGALFMEK